MHPSSRIVLLRANAAGWRCVLEIRTGRIEGALPYFGVHTVVSNQETRIPKLDIDTSARTECCPRDSAETNTATKTAIISKTAHRAQEDLQLRQTPLYRQEARPVQHIDWATWILFIRKVDIWFACSGYLTPLRWLAAILQRFLTCFYAFGADPAFCWWLPLGDVATQHRGASIESQRSAPGQTGSCGHDMRSLRVFGIPLLRVFVPCVSCRRLTVRQG